MNQVDISGYTKKDFANMLFPIYTTPKQTDLLKTDEFSKLRQYPSFKLPLKHLPKSLTIRYVMYNFDKNSPLHAINDILQRRHTGALLAGFKYVGSSNEFAGPVEDLIRGKNWYINFMIIEFCIMQASDDWQTLMTFQEALWRENLTLLDPESSGGNLAKIITNIDSLRSKIQKLRNEIFYDIGKDKLLTGDLYKFSEKERLKLRPEDFAKRLGFYKRSEDGKTEIKE